jgi:tetratricopeptide (TPR) repeat protein
VEEPAHAEQPPRTVFTHCAHGSNENVDEFSAVKDVLISDPEPVSTTYSERCGGVPMSTGAAQRTSVPSCVVAPTVRGTDAAAATVHASASSHMACRLFCKMGNAQGGYAAAKALCDEGKFAEAVPLLEQVYRQQRGTKQQQIAASAALAILANACEQLGRFERALQVWTERRALEERQGVARREDTAASRFGQARCNLWLGRFEAAAELLEVALLDAGVLGAGPQLMLALAQYFLSLSTGNAEWRRKAVASVERSVAERESGPAPLLVTALMLQFEMEGEASVALFKRAYGVMALSLRARDDLERLVRYNLVFLTLELARTGATEAAVGAGRMCAQLVERLELRRSLLHAETLFALGMALALSDKTQAVAVLTEAKELLTTLVQTSGALYGRATFELGSLLLQLRRAREALVQLEECLRLFRDRSSDDGHARSLVLYMQALQQVGDVPRSEAARKQQAEIAGSIKFATFSRKTQLAVLASLGEAPKADEKKDGEDEEVEREDFESFQDTFLAAPSTIASPGPVRPTPVSPSIPTRSPPPSPRAAAVVADRNRGRRSSVVDLFPAAPLTTSGTLTTSGAAIASPVVPRATPGTPVSPRVSPRPQDNKSPVASPRRSERTERTTQSPMASPRRSERTEKAPVAAPRPPERPLLVRKDSTQKEAIVAGTTSVAPPPRDDSESMRVALTTLRPSVADVFSCPTCGTPSAANLKACLACGSNA